MANEFCTWMILTNPPEILWYIGEHNNNIHLCVHLKVSYFFLYIVLDIIEYLKTYTDSQYLYTFKRHLLPGTMLCENLMDKIQIDYIVKNFPAVFSTTSSWVRFLEKFWNFGFPFSLTCHASLNIFIAF